MLIFNHQLIFVDEPHLIEENLSLSAQTILILHGSNLSYETLFSQSEWVDMASHQVRYYQHKMIETSWGLEIEDMLTLFWDGTNIIYLKGRDYTAQKLHFWVLHTFLPMVFQLAEKYQILHVGAVEIAGEAVLFSAFSYGGKSTLTDYFIQCGHRLLGDDTVAVRKADKGYEVIASYPYHRPYREVGTLGKRVEGFIQRPLSLKAIYWLEKTAPQESVSLKELEGVEKLKYLTQSGFIDFSTVKKAQFLFLGEMAKVIPLYKITIPWDKKRLNEVYEKIIG